MVKLHVYNTATSRGRGFRLLDMFLILLADCTGSQLWASSHKKGFRGTKRARGHPSQQTQTHQAETELLCGHKYICMQLSLNILVCLLGENTKTHSCTARFIFPIITKCDSYEVSVPRVPSFRLKLETFEPFPHKL